MVGAIGLLLMFIASCLYFLVCIDPAVEDNSKKLTLYATLIFGLGVGLLIAGGIS